MLQLFLKAIFISATIPGTHGTIVLIFPRMTSFDAKSPTVDPEIFSVAKKNCNFDSQTGFCSTYKILSWMSAFIAINHNIFL